MLLAVIAKFSHTPNNCIHKDYDDDCDKWKKKPQQTKHENNWNSSLFYVSLFIP
jgi:hypothetical protein